ncbi:MAG: hypothetical protein HKN67_03985 [Saprospiraceae bacterium]|nr:hypothetical protein [Saprospiraceae bacterium]
MLISIGLTEIDAQANQAITQVESDSKREEVQRYFGYELLLYRYLSLPYDVSLNVNEHGSFVEIGYLYVIFFPILLLFLSRKKLFYFLGVLSFTLFSWIISTSNSFVYSDSKGKINTSIEAIDAYLQAEGSSLETISVLMAHISRISLVLYKPFLALGESVSGNKDGVTYPVIIIIFLLGSLLLNHITRKEKTIYRLFFTLFWVYSFFWFAFAGGIIWYGYILLLLGIFLINILLRKLKEEDPLIGKYLDYSFLVLGTVWIILGFMTRLSSIQDVSYPSEIGKGLINAAFYEYGLGKIKKNETIDKAYPNASAGLNVINQDPEGLVWRVGTRFTYFISNNTERVFMDNQLGLFYELYKKYPNQNQLTDVFKASNVKYIIVDLYTHQIDKTPQKTLTEKYRQLLIFLMNNPRAQLLATDRILQTRNANNNIEYIYGVFGEVYQFGSYAIYQLN